MRNKTFQVVIKFQRSCKVKAQSKQKAIHKAMNMFDLYMPRMIISAERVIRK